MKCVIVTMLVEQGGKELLQTEFIEDHGGTWSRVKTNNSGRGRQGETRLKNTRKLIKEKPKQVRTN